MDGRDAGALELLLAVFRLAVCDATGLAYGHDDPAPPRPVAALHQTDALTFLHSTWGKHLADLAGLPIAEIRRRVDATDGGCEAAAS